MRLARKLALLALALIAAVAFSAAPASAANKVEISEVPDGGGGQTHCPALSSGGCQVHVVGLMSFRLDLGIFGEAAEAVCTVEVDMQVNETGDISVKDVNERPPIDANCTDDSSAVVVECNLPWSGGGESVNNGTIVASVNACLNPAEGGSDCIGTLKFTIVEDAKGHIDMVFNNAVVDLCELDVDLEIEHATAGNDNINITP